MSATTHTTDIAVLTDSGNDSVCSLREPQSCSTRCNYYLRNTMNFNPKGYCDVNHNVTGATVTSKLSHSMWIQNKWYNNRYDCVHDKSGLFAWYEISHSDNLQLSEDSFVCAKTQFARVNQLGNARSDDVVSQSQPISSGGVVNQHIVEGVNANRFLWTIPTIPKPKVHILYLFKPHLLYILSTARSINQSSSSSSSSALHTIDCSIYQSIIIIIIIDPELLHQ